MRQLIKELEIPIEGKGTISIQIMDDATLVIKGAKGVQAFFSQPCSSRDSGGQVLAREGIRSCEVVMRAYVEEFPYGGSNIHIGAHLVGAQESTVGAQCPTISILPYGPDSICTLAGCGHGLLEQLWRVG